eukprot:UN24595
MFLAGHTENSADLQSAIGYGRVFYNITTLMTMFGCLNYIDTVIPGALGAERKDRVANYFRRSVILCTGVLIPIWILQFFAHPIMENLGVKPHIARDVGLYCRWMCISSFLLMIDACFEICFVNLGYVKSAAFNSFITGTGVDVFMSYLLIYKYQWGIEGVVYTQIIVKTCRNLFWCVLVLVTGEYNVILFTETKEKILTWKEFKIFKNLALPAIASSFTGWFIFEIQIMAMANIPRIPKDALAAGAIWVQFETTLAAIQSGWLQVTSMRTLVLLGKEDENSRTAWTLFSVLCAVAVLMFNIILYILKDQIVSVVSNNSEVRYYFGKIFWVLMVHAQIRISCINAKCLFTPIGKGFLGVAANAVTFYFIAVPIGVTMALTDLVTRDLITKMTFCVATTSLACLLLGIFGFTYLCRLDWIELAKNYKKES